MPKQSAAKTSAKSQAQKEVSTVKSLKVESAEVKSSAKAVKSTKGAQAREKIKKAALRVLEREGYHQMRVKDVTEQAGVATGLFYHYFKDLHSLTIEVLNDFVSGSQNLEEIEKDIAKGDWYARIYAHNHLVVSSYAKRPGVIRCLFQMADNDAAFAELLHQQFIKQLSWLVNLLPKMFPQAKLKKNQALLIVYTLAGSSERILRDYYINLSIKNNSVLFEKKLKVEEMTELLSVMFYRGLFLQNPAAEKLKYMTNITSLANNSR